jgi:hypothetical protein
MTTPTTPIQPGAAVVWVSAMPASRTRPGRGPRRRAGTRHPAARRLHERPSGGGLQRHHRAQLRLVILHHRSRPAPGQPWRRGRRDAGQSRPTSTRSPSRSPPRWAPAAATSTTSSCSTRSWTRFAAPLIPRPHKPTSSRCEGKRLALLALPPATPARYLRCAAARQPPGERAEHESGLGCKRDVGRHADDDAERQSHHGPERDRGSDAHVGQCTSDAPTPGRRWAVCGRLACR